MQYGFKKKHGTTQCTFVVTEIIKYYVNNDTNVYVTLLDASKAFDRVHYVKLFQLLKQRKLCPIMLRFLIVFYTNQFICVQWCSTISPLCHVTNGVKQGGVLSPILFTVYIDELLCRLSRAKIGCFVGNNFCGAVGYADDLTLLAPNITSLNAMLDICQSFADSFNVLFNSSKSKLLYFGRPEMRPSVSPVMFNGSMMELVESEKHLGHVFGQNSVKDQIQSSVNTFTAKANMVMSHFHYVHPDNLYSLLKTYGMPLYSSQLWDYSSTHVDKLYVAWRKAIRKILKLPYRTHSALLPYIVDDMSPDLQLYQRLLTFIKNISRSQNYITDICYKLAVYGSGSPVSNSMSVLCNVLSTTRHELHAQGKITMPPYVTNLSICASVIRDLLYMRFNPTDWVLSGDEIDFMLEELCTN